MILPSKWIGTSWKMNGTLGEALAYAETLRQAAPSIDPRIQSFVIPPFTVVREVKAALADTSVKVGAQNMHWADKGSWTGEISAPMLTDCGLDMVELGHSERREHFGETDERVAMKVEAALRHGLTPLICVGETLEERESGRTGEVLDRQVRTALSDIGPADRSGSVLLAYEPVWAIGEKGIPATADYADEQQGRIAALASDMLGRPVPCLYGGSVNARNCADFIACPHIDGLFVGRSAWTAEGYLELLARCAAQLGRGEK